MFKFFQVNKIKMGKVGKFFFDTIQVIVFALSIFAFVYLLILQPHKINGQSMMPNFPDGEFLLTDKVTYRYKEPQRGDVVVFKPPTNKEEEFIKRIIGLPGDRVSLNNGKFLVNGLLLQEDYIDGKVYTSGGSFLREGTSIVIPQESYFVAGDNRPHSSDSRQWGTINKKAITGRAWLVYWPLSNAGTVESPDYGI